MQKAAYWALVLFVFTIALQESLTELVYGYTGSIPRMVGIGAFGIGVLALLINPQLRNPTKNHVLIFFFFAWAGVSFVWAVDTQLGLSRAFSYFQMGAMVWLLLQFAPQRDRQTTLMAAYVLGNYVTIALLLQGYSTGALMSTGIMAERYVAFNTDPNEQALMLAIGIPMAWNVVSQRKGVLQLAMLVYIPAAFIAVTLTGSRGGLLSAVAGLLLIPLNYRQVSHSAKVLSLGLLVAGLFLVSVLLPESTYERLMSLQEMVVDQRKYAGSSFEDTNIRVLIWKEGLETFVDYPALGVGSGAFPEAIDPVRGNRFVAHSVWISVLTELGIIGFGIFMLIGILTFLTILKMEKSERHAWLIIFLTWGIGVSFLTWEHRKPTWLILGMVAAREAWIQAQRQRRVRKTRAWAKPLNAPAEPVALAART